MSEAYSKDVKAEELARILEYPAIQSSKRYTRILKALVARWLEKENEHWPSNEMAEELCGDTHSPEPNLRSYISRLNNNVLRAYRRQEKSAGQISVTISSNRHGYRLEFEQHEGGRSTGLSKAVDQFWTQIYLNVLNSSPAHDSCRFNIFFSNETVEPPAVESLKQASRKAPAGHAYTQPWNGSDRALWSGTGEVMGAFFLGQLFSHLDIQPHIHRSSTISGETRLTNQVSVFIGSSLAIKHLYAMRDDPSVRKKQRYQFQWGPGGRGEIRDKAAEKTFQCDPSPESRLEHTDYGLVSYFYDAAHNQAVVGLAGISTLGTEQAVKELSVTPSLPEKIFAKFRKPGTIGEFEALLKVNVSRHEPTSSTLHAFSTPTLLKKLREERRFEKKPTKAAAR